VFSEEDKKMALAEILRESLTDLVNSAQLKRQWDSEKSLSRLAINLADRRIFSPKCHITVQFTSWHALRCHGIHRITTGFGFRFCRARLGSAAHLAVKLAFTFARCCVFSIAHSHQRSICAKFSIAFSVCCFSSIRL